MLDVLWKFIQLLCTFIMTVGGAGAIVIGIIRWMRKPDTTRDERLKKHDELLDNDNKRLKALEEHQAEIEESQKLMMRALVALMRHEIDGNNDDQLLKESEKLNEYIFNK